MSANWTVVCIPHHAYYNIEYLRYGVEVPTSKVFLGTYHSSSSGSKPCFCHIRGKKATVCNSSYNAAPLCLFLVLKMSVLICREVSLPNLLPLISPNWKESKPPVVLDILGKMSHLLSSIVLFLYTRTFFCLIIWELLELFACVVVEARYVYVRIRMCVCICMCAHACCRCVI